MKLTLKIKDEKIECDSIAEAGWHLADRWLHGPIPWGAVLLCEGALLERGDEYFDAVIRHARGLLLNASNPDT